MNEQILDTLRNLRANPARAVELYQQLFDARFWALVSDADVALDEMFFLNYPTEDGIQELPIFTAPDRRLIGSFATATLPPTAVEVAGRALWRRLLLVMEHGHMQVAVDPGEGYGIRLTRTMILGMVNKYGDASQAT
jgi:hypothetical protein